MGITLIVPNISHSYEIIPIHPWQNLIRIPVFPLSLFPVLVLFIPINKYYWNKLCAWRHDMPPPLSSPSGAPAPRALPSRRNVAVVSHAQYVLTVTTAPASRVKAALSKVACDLDFWPYDLESGVRVTCGVGYLCANFGLPRPLCSRVRPDVRDRQTSEVRQYHRLMPPSIRGGERGMFWGD